VTPEWKVGADAAVVGSQYFVGDDSNLNAKVPAYWVANLHTSYQISKDVQVFGWSPTCSISATTPMGAISRSTASPRRYRSPSPIRAP
jgi:outer membrane receptor protein involved in Fe transport